MVITLTDEEGNETTTVTDSDGNYSFTGLEPGDYTVEEGDPTDFVSVSDADGPNDNTIAATVVGGEDTPDNDFVDEQLASIAGTVFEDVDGDDAGDDPIANVTLGLFADNNGDGVADSATPTATTTTDSNGAYLFEDVFPGDYVVVETQPAGFDTVTDLDSTPDTDLVANGSTTDDLIPVSVAGGELDDGNDFVEEVQSGSISGTVLALSLIHI